MWTYGISSHHKIIVLQSNNQRKRNQEKKSTAMSCSERQTTLSTQDGVHNQHVRVGSWLSIAGSTRITTEHHDRYQGGTNKYSSNYTKLIEVIDSVLDLLDEDDGFINSSISSESEDSNTRNLDTFGSKM